MPGDRTLYAKSPSFPFYFKDWRSSRKVQRMSFKERGIYLELLIEQWDTGPLPNDAKALAFAIGAKDTDFAKSWPTLRQCFTEQPDGRLLSEPLELIRQRQDERRDRASEAGKAGAANRWPKHAVAIPDAHTTASGVPHIAFAVAGASAIASAGAVAKPPAAQPVNGRSRHPIFRGQRFVVFDWQLEDLSRLLGPHLEVFDLHAWFFDLDARMVQAQEVVPQRDGGKWLQEQTSMEAQRRGIVLSQSTAGPSLADIQREIDAQNERASR